MHRIPGLALRLSQYKCFASFQGFEAVKRINVVIGKNNTGKSSLIDLVEAFASHGWQFPDSVRAETMRTALGGVRALPQVQVQFRLSSWLSERLFFSTLQNLASHNAGLGSQAGAICAAAPDVLATVTRAIGQGNYEVSLERQHELGVRQDAAQRLATLMESKRLRLAFRKLSSERNVVAEESEGDSIVDEHGVKATRLIERFYNQDGQQRELITGLLLNELNRILVPDARFDEIYLGRTGKKWQVKFRANGQEIRLSRMGSGLKTVLLVLLNLHVVPEADSNEIPISDYVFCFEELENNLHPSLLRRLLAYIRQFVIEKNCTMFLTTHSPIVIDVFGRDREAQIVHVSSSNGETVVKQLSGHSHGLDVVKELGHRPSDVLMTNVVIWVEGPSDREYLVRWIDLYSEGQLTEHVHYEVVSYGGSLLSHIRFDGAVEEPKVPAEDLVQAIRISPHSIVVMDRDRKNGTASLKTWVERVVTEATQSGALAWVTSGREIENYLSPSLIARAVGTAIDPSDEFVRVFAEIKNRGGKKWERKKLAFAERLTANMARTDLLHLDLKDKIHEVCARIADWNGATFSPSPVTQP